MLLVWGDRDPVLPVSHARAAARELPGCQLEVVPRAGHLPHRADPERFAAALNRFITETTAASHDPVRWRRLLDGDGA
jgi:pimeloyl-ACP methyl ester carboxylesterase